MPSFNHFLGRAALPRAGLFGAVLPLSLRPNIHARALSKLHAPILRLQPLHAAGRRCKATLALDAAGAGSHGGAGATSGSSARTMGYWLAGMGGMVFVMVVLGGVTRLTRSGLSIVEWRPEGEVLPMNDADWAVEFEKYKRFPEYQRVNSRMSLEEFKPIYFMEWFHRMWGRAIGVAFAAPLAYFALSRKVPAGFGGRLGVLLGLGCAQGGVGWWMVKSGLEHERFGEFSIPRVSPYRLATHLGFAWTIYSALMWNAWDLLRAPGVRAVVTPAQAAAAARMRPVVALSTAIIGATVASGAFVAGNDAGHAYNDWPFFAGKLVPEQIWDEALGWRNVTENTATVQFDHRMLAYSSILGVGLVHAAAGRAGGLRSASMPPGYRQAAVGLGALVALQATLGITTLMLYVPPWLGAAHQGGALALWTGALYALHTVHTAAKAGVASGTVSPALQGAAKTAGGAGAASLAALAVLLKDREEDWE